MSANFNWDQFDSVSQEKPVQESSEFNWDQFEEAPSKVARAKREVGRAGKTIGSTLLGMPGDVAQSIQNIPKYLSEKLTGRETPKEVSSILRALGPFAGLPTSQEVSGGVEQVLPSLAPKDEQEREQEENLSLLTSLLVPSPGGKGKAVQKFTDPKTLDKLYKAGKAMGLSPKQLTPLFQGPLKTQAALKIGGKSKGLEKAIALSGEALSDLYTKLGEKAAKLPRLSEQTTENMVDKFTKIRSQLGKTIQPSPDKQAAIHFIENAIEKINNSGATPEELVNFYQDINSAINWNAIKNGRKVLGNLKKPVLEALKEASPKIAREFENTNALYSKYKNFEKMVGPSKLGDFIEFGKWSGLLAGLVSGNVKKTLGAAVGVSVAPKISEQLLTNPKWQSLTKRILHSIKEGSKPAAFKAFQMLKEKVKKEMPEEYEDIDWDEFTED
jgi:hypothetical protein